MTPTIRALLFTLLVTTVHGQTIKYSSSWFGPNANPVPEFTDATIPSLTTLTLTADYYFGHGDETRNNYAKLEIPFIAQKLSLKVWSTLFEHYHTSTALMRARNSVKLSGHENGDIYVQTRISILSEQNHCPAIILNSTLKTAASATYTTRRYFDTPGYYFDFETAKSLHLHYKYLQELRAVTELGFMCWETNNSLQDDAPMYGLKLIAGNDMLKWENTLSGYWGWLHTSKVHNPGGDYGDSPLDYSTKMVYKKRNFECFAQYQYGIIDFPYQQLRVGVSIALQKLTPHYKITNQTNK